MIPIQPDSGQQVVFTTNEPRGNPVHCFQVTWTNHVVTPIGHPEMAGYEEIVEQFIQDPMEVRFGRYSDSRVFVSDPNQGPRAEGMRATVWYDDMEKYMAGMTFGMLTTAYPIDHVRYPPQRIGDVEFKRGGTK